MPRNTKDRKTKGKKRNRSSISAHSRQGKKLVPPAVVAFEKINAQHVSWMNDRLPEMLWVSLILASFDRQDAFAELNRILEFIFNHPRKVDMKDLTLSGISRLDEGPRSELISAITANPRTARALASLTIFDSLPAREDWASKVTSDDQSVDLLMSAVGGTLWHQSTMATDCRWLRVMGMVVAGCIRFHSKLTELVEAIRSYPNLEPDCPEGARVRVTEIGFDSGLPADRTWPKGFWTEAWEKSPCVELVVPGDSVDVSVSTTRERLQGVLTALEKHWNQTHLTTEVDAKHDAVFGMAFYSLRIIRELMSFGMSSGILARLGLRTLLELRINLKYLVDQDDVALWQEWRKYGAGQAKLTSLKADDFQDPPQFIDLESLEGIASEDMWEEFVTIDFGSWTGADLRKISEQVSVKETYDKYYPWASSYSHAMWGAVRESSYRTCANPLHRLHRYPEDQALGDCLYDAVILVDDILGLVDAVYPSFTARVMESNSLNFN